MRQVFAYTFTSPLSLADLHSRLNTIGPWEWIDRESERFGDYLSTRVLDSPDRGMIKVYSELGYYAVNVLLQSDDPMANERFTKIKDTLFKIVLPSIEANDIAPTETYE